MIPCHVTEGKSTTIVFSLLQNAFQIGKLHTKTIFIIISCIFSTSLPCSYLILIFTTKTTALPTFHDGGRLPEIREERPSENIDFMVQCGLVILIMVDFIIRSVKQHISP